jgi:hypothetical protein
MVKKRCAVLELWRMERIKGSRRVVDERYRHCRASVTTVVVTPSSSLPRCEGEGGAEEGRGGDREEREAAAVVRAW